ncbi:serine-rich adhesin for platelets-like [Ptychodera flava]|uniref:serine-rich adhesin for platelets-like n=1 Tax=Ptychodera flava TaxID=63121 RepID=UPI00396A66A6
MSTAITANLLFFTYCVYAQSGRINHALGKSATQSSIYLSAGASRAVDGSKSGNFNDGTCTCTLNEYEAWWKVDLGGVYLVNRVCVVNRQDCCAGRLEGAVVRVGNNRVFSQNDMCEDALRLDEVREKCIIFHCNDLSGRYVSIQLEGSSRMLTLCEVEVFSDRDTEFPQITCPEDITATTSIGINSNAVTWSNPVATDDSGCAKVSSSRDPGSIFSLGETVVTYEAVDPSGNKDSCSFIVEMTDIESPSIDCPPDIVTDANTGMPSVSVTWSIPNATDNSGNVSVSGSQGPGSDFIIGVTVVSYEAIDQSGNKDLCSFTVRVQDIESPSIDCPQNIDTNTNTGMPSVSVTWSIPSASDNSGNVSVSSSHDPGSDFIIGVTDVSYEAVDPSGNKDSCSFTVRVQDVQSPSITCPPDVDTNPNIGGRSVPVTWQLPNATDNSGTVDVSGSHDPGSDFIIGVTVVSYEALDPSGNAESCSFAVRVQDIESPSIDCPPDIDTIANTGMNSVSVTWSIPSASDNSGNVSVSSSHDPGSDFIIGVTDVSYEAVDPSGNEASCSFAVRVQDIEKPLIICPGDAYTTAFIETPSATVFWSFPNATDNSGLVSLSGIHNPGDSFPIGLTVVIYDATDPSGNSDSCSFSVGVEAVVRPPLENVNQKISSAQVKECIDRISRIILGLDNIAVTPEERNIISHDILQSMDTCILAWMSVDEGTDEYRDLIIASVLNATDNLSKFVLHDREPGVVNIPLNSTSIHLRLEIDSVRNLSDSVFFGKGSGYTTLAADEIFVNITSTTIVNRVCTHLVGNFFRSRTRDSSRLADDVVALSFTDTDGDKLEVTNTTEDIQITLSTDSPPSEDLTVIYGVNLEAQNVTHFGLSIEITRLFHAVIIWFKNSQAIHGKTEAYVFDERVEFAESYIGYSFSVVLHFSGDHSTIFIPEHYFLRTGEYYLTFTIPQSSDITFSMSTKQARCGYMRKHSRTWASNGCQVSSTSNLTSTICLCNHITAFA